MTELTSFPNTLHGELQEAAHLAVCKWSEANRVCGMPMLGARKQRDLAAEVVAAVWTGIERAAIGIAEYIATEQLAAANRRVEAAREREDIWRDEILPKLAEVTKRAEKAEARIAELGEPQTEQGIRWPDGTDQEYLGYSRLAVMDIAADQGGQYIQRTAYRGPWLAAGGRVSGPAETSGT